MEANLIKIGNSVGVILPKAVLKQARLEGATRVEMSVQGGAINLKSVEPTHPRAGWEDQLKAAIAENGNIEAEEEDWNTWQTTPNEFDKDEWTW